MKTLRYLMLAFTAALLFAGCSDDDTYKKGEAESDSCYGVYFPAQENAGDVELDPTDPTTITLTAMRTNSEGSISVPITVTGSVAGLFTASNLTFDDGAEEATFTVSFPNAEIGTPYTCNIQIEDKDYAYLYGEKASGVSFTVTRVKWNRLTGSAGETTGKWREDIMTTFWTISNGETEIEIYERDDNPGYYRISNVYSAKFMAELFEDTEAEMSKYIFDTDIFIDATKPNKVWIPYTEIGVDLGYGSISAGSTVPENANATGLSITTTANYGTLADGIITFPVKGLLMSMPSYNSGGKYNSNLSGMLRIMLPGTKDYDYSYKLVAGESAEGKVPIAVTFGADVAKAKYAFFEGSFGDAIAKSNSAAIEAGTTESKEITATGVIDAQMEATGKYTIVANFYNAANELLGYKFATFGYIASDDEMPVALSVYLETTNQYIASGLTSENSVRLCVNSGETIESASYALFETDKLPATPDFVALVKAKGKAFTAAQLAEINGDGYAGMIGSLVGGTSYTAAVIAYNGYTTTAFTAEVTTDGVAHPLKRTYTYADFTDGIEKADLFKSWNAYAINRSAKETARTKLGTITFSENTANDVVDPENADNNVDMVNATGFDFGEVNNPQPILLEYYGGIIYMLQQQPMGTVVYQGNTLYCGYRISDYATGLGSSGMDYMMYAAYVEEGYLAMVCTSGNVKAGYNFDTFSIRAYSDEALTSAVGNWFVVSNIVLADPTVDAANPLPAAAKASASTASLRAIAEASIEPDNYVELRGRERIHAAIDQIIAKNKNANRGTLVMDVEVPTRHATVTAKTTFRANAKLSTNRMKLRAQAEQVAL